jgi:hypothetical protein
MFNERRFFNLAREWKKEGKDIVYFFILQEIMDHYFGFIAGYESGYRLAIKGKYTIADIVFVLDAIGYFNYSIEGSTIAGDTTVILRNQL